MDRAPPQSAHPDLVGSNDVPLLTSDVSRAPVIKETEPTEPETVITNISGHTWGGKGRKKSLSFRVEWEDNTITWEPLSKIDDCISLDVYLRHHGLTDPLKLSKSPYLM